MNSKLALFAVLSLAFAGCTTATSPVENINTNLDTNSNVVISTENQNENIIEGTSSGRIMNSLDGLAYTFATLNGEPVEGDFVLAFDEGRMATRICNQISGTYTLEGIRLSSLLVSTKMACVDDTTNNLETSFIGMFATDVMVTREGSKLTLEGAAGTTFTFEEEK